MGGGGGEELLALVDEDRIDDVLARLGLDGVAEAWCRYHRTPGRDEREPDRWAVELWTAPSWWERRDLVRAGLLALIARAGDDLTLANVAAGPLEDFVRGGDEEDLRWIEQHARRDPRFRRALAGVWIWDRPRRVFERVQAAAGVALARPDDEGKPGDRR